MKNDLTKTKIILVVLWSFTYSYVGTSLGVKKDIYYLFIGGSIYFGGLFLILYVVDRFKNRKTKK
ncbi:hypothetical protein ACFQZ1_10335 [Bacillus sp. CGMCC 1.60114]